MNNPTVQTDLVEVLKEIRDEQKKTSEKLDRVEKELIVVKTKLDTELPAIKENIKELKGAQQAQIWTLIGVLIAAVGGFVVAVARNVLTFKT